MKTLAVFGMILILLVLVNQSESFCQSSSGPDNPAVVKAGKNPNEASQPGGTEEKFLIGGSEDPENIAVIEEAKKQLEVMCFENGELGEYFKKFRIKGEFVVDLTLQGKGKVVTVFMVSSNVDIKDQNALKNKLKELEFPNIKLPKNKRVKFRYTLNL